MRAGIEITVTPEDRRRLDAIARDRNAKLKHVARAKVILATADGCGTMEVMRHSGLSDPGVWRWRERFMHAGVDGSCATRPVTFFATLTKQRCRRGVYRSIIDFQAAIHRYITEHNTEPKPFVWTADPGRVLAAINRGKQAFESAH